MLYARTVIMNAGNICQARVSPSRSPLAKGFLGLVEGLVEHGWGNSKATEHFHREMAKVNVSAKNSSDHNQENRVYRRHNDETTNSVRPRTIFEISFKTQDVFHSRADLSKPKDRNVRK
jgi:hypothetical protein